MTKATAQASVADAHGRLILAARVWVDPRGNSQLCGRYAYGPRRRHPSARQRGGEPGHEDDGDCKRGLYRPVIRQAR
jgi:hypothetical protein